MTKASCHTCVYACWDLCQAMQGFSSGWPSRAVCANHADAPGQLRPTPLGSVCRNYRARPATPEGDVKRIPLTGGFYTYVDAADYEWLSRYSWQVYAGGYAARREKGKVIFMHREIMKPPKGTVVDHIDGSKGNNCRFNLRVCTPAENCRNRVKRAHSTSRFMGISYNKRRDKYSARLRHKGQVLWLGYFDDEVEAARAHDCKAVERCGPFARLNLPEEWPPERIQEVYRPQAKNRPKQRRKNEKAGPKRQTHDAHRKTKKGEGKKVRKNQGKKVRTKEGKSPRGKKTTPPARTPGRRTRAVRRTAKSARRR